MDWKNFDTELPNDQLLSGQHEGAVGAHQASATRHMPQMDPKEMIQQAFQQMTPEERLQFGQQLIAQARAEGLVTEQQPALQSRPQPTTPQDILGQMLGGTGNADWSRIAMGTIAALGLGTLLSAGHPGIVARRHRHAHRNGGLLGALFGWNQRPRGYW